jgi:SPP1 gp7 family putative phage head morphogenesis protein
MGLFNFGKKDKVLSNALIYTPISEALKGLTENKKVRFPKELGEEHPFNFQKVEKLCKKVGILAAIVDKHIDFIMSGGINIASEDKKAETIISEFMHENQFDTIIRNWLREALIKNGFLELGGSKDDTITEIKILDAEYMYVNRDEYGKVLDYRQYTKPINQFDKKRSSKEVEIFKPYEIAHLAINTYSDEAYGMGLINQLLLEINYLLGARKEMHTIMERKANNPFFFIMGDKDKDRYPTPAQMDDLGQRLEHLNNKHEWVLSAFTEPKVLDTGNFAEKFEFIIQNNIEMIYSAAQIPAVLMGVSNIPEGLAKVQMRAFEMRIQSMREEIEKVIEEKIFKRVLNAQGIDSHVEIIWGLPSQEEKNARATILIQALQNPFISPVMRDKIEEELTLALDIEYEEAPEEERRKEEEEETQPVIPEERKTEPKRFPRSGETQEHICNNINHEDCGLGYTAEAVETVRNMTVQEWVGFNYSKFKNDVLKATNSDAFSLLSGKTKTELSAGLLSQSEVDKLRTTLYEGFENNLSIRDIENGLNKRIDFKDRYMLKDGKLVLRDGRPILSLSKDFRANMIARTETVRLSNLGALENYKDNNVEKARWVSAVSERTCAECVDLNGMIFETKNMPVMPPLHPDCRCTISPVIE